jgi:hypothetical protein
MQVDQMLMDAFCDDVINISIEGFQPLFRVIERTALVFLCVSLKIISV